MGNLEHLDLLEAGTDAVRAWQNNNPGVRFNLRKLYISPTDLSGANLSHATFTKAGFEPGVVLVGANLSMACLRKVIASKVKLSSANLTGADLTKGGFFQTDFSDANLKDADLTEAFLYKANLSGANLAGADLTHANLLDANLRGANLTRANLSNASLIYANLSGANLSRADLERADLYAADLLKAELDKAVFSWADLRCADLTGVSCLGTSFCSTKFGHTILHDLDLSTALYLPAAVHKYPSLVNAQTLQLSLTPDSAEFFFNCGVSKEQLRDPPHRANLAQPSHFRSCFISYSHRDEAFVKKLTSRMREKGINVWCAADNIRGGQKIHQQIKAAITRYDKLLLVLSEQSMASNWVGTELYEARQRELSEGTRILFPIRLVSWSKVQRWECFDADIGKDIAREIREYFIPDFSNWEDDDAFASIFEQLLESLKV